MTISEQSRHELYTRLQAALGDDAATTLMEHLPPVGWADVATKRDLDNLESRLLGSYRKLDGKIDAVESRLDSKIDVVESRLAGKIDALENRLLAAFRSEMMTLQRTFILALMGSVSGSTLTAAGLAFAAARLV